MLYTRSVVVHKGDGDLGVVLCGGNPVVIQTVIPRSAADKAGILKGDCVMSINDNDMRCVNVYAVITKLGVF
ncbi:MAG: PDZ domain-containing protein [Bacteroidota bacterium]